jgi:hypothetical protein
MVNEHDRTDGAICSRLRYDDNGERADDDQADDS